jgi:catechol 2,3-dioxygenase-like lactoylglutathione lyase family enzyme
MGFSITRLDHVQLAMSVGGEASARAFYVDLLGLVEVPKPPVLAARGGCWFVGGDFEVHLGAEEDFRPARKAHPALVVAGYDELVASLAAAGYLTRPDEDIPGVVRCHVDDPFGNRIELIAEGGDEPLSDA